MAKESGRYMNLAWQDATWAGDTDWDGVHAVMGNMPEHEMGWYRGLCDALMWTQGNNEALFPKGVLSVDAPEGYGFSASGQNRDAPSFYGEGKPAEDNVQVRFDPMKLLCVAAEVDREASISYVDCTLKVYEFMGPCWRIHVCGTEGTFGVPTDWPKGDVHSHIWRPFGRVAKELARLVV